MSKIIRSPKQVSFEIEDINGKLHEVTVQKITTPDWIKITECKLAIDQFVILFGVNKDDYENNFHMYVIREAVNYGLECLSPQESGAK